MSKGKGKAGSGGTGGGPSTKAAGAGSSGQGSSGQGSSRPSASPSRPIGFRTEEDAVQAAPPLAAEAADGAQQTEPQPAGGGKKEKERLRKERQRQRKVEEAWEALQGAIEQMEETAGGMHAVEEAMQVALKHEARSERLAALVAEARELIEQARAAEAAKVAAAAVVASAAAAVEAVAKAEAAVKRQQLEEEASALTLKLQQVQAELGSGSGTPQLDEEETQCVVCFDAPKDHIIVPCGHQCVCGACAEQLTRTRTPTCPVCREPIRETVKVFCT
jgi:hypothetical protein